MGLVGRDFMGSFKGAFSAGSSKQYVSGERWRGARERFSGAIVAREEVFRRSSGHDEAVLGLKSCQWKLSWKRLF